MQRASLLLHLLAALTGPTSPLECIRTKGLVCVCGRRRLKEATGRLVVAWVLASACLTGHLAHLWKGAPAWLHLFGRPSVHAAMSALALVGVYPILASHFQFAFALTLPLPFVLPFADVCFCPSWLAPFLLPYGPSLPSPSFCLCPALLLPCASLPQPFCLSASVGVLVLSSSERRAQDKELVYMPMPILPVILCTLEFEWYCHHPTFAVCAFPPPVSLDFRCVACT